jgi:diacylglycerol kinase family enzyme
VAQLPGYEAGLRERVSMGAIPFFLNRASGSAQVVADLLEEDHRFEPRYPPTPDEFRKSVSAVAQQGIHRIVVAGGDGTLSLAADVLAGSGVELAIIPAGTLNHFARSLKIPEHLDAALDLAATGTARPIDIAYVNDRVMLNTSSVGAYIAFVNKRTRFRKRLGYWLATLVAAIRVAARPGRQRVIIEVEGRRRRYLTPVILVHLGRLLSLRSRGVDQTVEEGLHVLAFRSVSPLRLFVLLTEGVLFGPEYLERSREVDRFVTRNFILESAEGVFNVAVDGETLRMPGPLKYRHAPRALSVIVPEPGTPATEI